MSNNNQNEPNPPTWPDSVMVVTPSTPTADLEETLAIFASDPWKTVTVPDSHPPQQVTCFTSDLHFSSRRRAVLFAPGTYALNLQVGYYSQVLGLGSTPDKVIFQDDGETRMNGPFISALNRHLHTNPSQDGTCLDTFWRSAENFTTRVSGRSSKFPSNQNNDGMHWAVSQACPLRRIVVEKSLELCDRGAYASGGFLANVQIKQGTFGRPQQQFFLRNAEFGAIPQVASWSAVYSGCSQNLPSSGGNLQVTVHPTPRVRLEKPYISLHDEVGKVDKYELRIPQLVTDPSETVGVIFSGSGNFYYKEEVRDFTRVRVVHDGEEDITSRIQDALDNDKDVVLAPGIFHLKKPIEIRRHGRVLLGIGMATLVAPGDGTPCLHVAPGVHGVRVAGLMFEASESVFPPTITGKSCLLEWGEEGISDEGSAGNPGGLFDVFCRVGGAITQRRDRIRVDCMVRIHSGNIIGDNVWLWRADHAQLGDDEAPNYPDISETYWQTTETEFRVETGLEVFGNNVTINGLAVEHANGHQTVWHGENGLVVFYQCELPYDVTQASFGGTEGYRGYLVPHHVKKHEVLAPGVYSNFREQRVLVSTAMEHSSSDGVRFVNPFTVRLDNNFGLQAVVNHRGRMANTQGKPVRVPAHE